MRENRSHGSMRRREATPASRPARAAPEASRRPYNAIVVGDSLNEVSVMLALVSCRRRAGDEGGIGCASKWVQTETLVDGGREKGLSRFAAGLVAWLAGVASRCGGCLRLRYAVNQEGE